MKRSEICLRQQVHNTYVLHQSQAVLKHKFDHVQHKKFQLIRVQSSSYEEKLYRFYLPLVPEDLCLWTI